MECADAARSSQQPLSARLLVQRGGNFSAAGRYRRDPAADGPHEPDFAALQPIQVHRATAKMWNVLVDMFPEKSLRKVEVPVSLLRGRGCRSRSSQELPRRLEPLFGMGKWRGPVRRRRSQAGAESENVGRLLSARAPAATVLVQAGTDPSSIRSLADLTKVEAFKTILRKRHEATNGEASYETFFLAHL